MASAAPHRSALEKTEQDKAKNDATLQELGREIKEAEAKIKAILEHPKSDQDGRKRSFQEEKLARLLKDKDALLEKDKAFDASITRLRELEAQQGAATSQPGVAAAGAATALGRETSLDECSENAREETLLWHIGGQLHARNLAVSRIRRHNLTCLKEEPVQFHFFQVPTPTRVDHNSAEDAAGGAHTDEL
eukprot:m.180164 g.180164  ORF g.180164 m.180164 type:complete len:191 (+) comp9990_c2_seq14:101-673(+)